MVTKTDIKKATVKTAKVAGATVSLGWSVLVFLVAASVGRQKTNRLVQIASK